MRPLSLRPTVHCDPRGLAGPSWSSASWHLFYASRVWSVICIISMWQYTCVANLQFDVTFSRVSIFSTLNTMTTCSISVRLTSSWDCFKHNPAGSQLTKSTCKGRFEIRGLKLNLPGGRWRQSLGEAGPHQLFHKKKLCKKKKKIQSSQMSLLTVL